MNISGISSSDPPFKPLSANLHIGSTTKSRDQSIRSQLSNKAFVSNVLNLSKSLNGLHDEFSKAKAHSTKAIAEAKYIEISAIEQKALLKDVDKFNGIGNGSFSINGVDIKVNRNKDSLEDIIEAINRSDSGVKASYDSVKGEMVISSHEKFTIKNGDSNFFAAVKVKTGTYDVNDKLPMNGEDSYQTTDVFLESFQQFVSDFNNLYQQAPGENKHEEKNLFSFLEDSINNSFDENSFPGAQEIGLSVDFETNENVLSLDAIKFQNEIANHSDKLYETFMGGESFAGIMQSMISSLNEFSESAAKVNGDYPGLLINTTA